MLFGLMWPMLLLEMSRIKTGLLKVPACSGWRILLVAGLMTCLCAEEVRAQERVLVSNLGQANAPPVLGSTGGPIATALGIADHAQSFTTGSNSSGYKLNSVEIQFGRIATGLTYKVSIHQSGTSGPGAEIGALTTPTFSTSTTGQTLTFSAGSDGITLAASTEYFIVLDVSGTRTNQITTWRNTQSDDEDSSGLNDWTIDNDHIYRCHSINALFCPNLNWLDNLQSSSLKFRINGEVLIPPGVTVSPTSLTVTEASGASQTQNYTVVLDTAPTGNVTIAVSSSNTNIATVNVSSLTFTGSNWNKAQMITVTGVDDSVNQVTDQMATIEHMATSSDTSYNAIDIADVAVTVTDNDNESEISVGLPSVKGITIREGVDLYPESAAAATFNIMATPAPSSSLTVCINVAEQFGDRVAGKGHMTVTIPSGTGATSVTTRAVTWSDDSADERDSRLRLAIIAPSDSNCSQAGYTVSSTNGSREIWIGDDDATEVALEAGSDIAMTEGNATDTALITVSLSRRLFEGETATVPVDLASTTGMRLPGTMTPDFAVTVSGTGAAIVDAESDSPDVMFTGHDTNTVQTATMTFAPVANLDDGDAEHEILTATLGADSVLSASGQSSIGGGMRRATNFRARLTMADDEAAPPSLVVSETALRLSESSGSTSYTVALGSAPTQDVTVTIGRGGSDWVALSNDSLTFTPTDWAMAQAVTVTAADEPTMHRNRSLTLSHLASSTDTRYNITGASISVEVLDAPEVTAYEPFGLKRKPEFEGTWTDNGNGRHGWSGPSLKPPMPMNEFYSAIRRDVVVFEALDYYIHLSNRPVGGDVTVTATVADFSEVGLALTRNGSPRQSLTLTFNDSEAAGGRCVPFAQEGADGPWRCNRKVWIIRKLPASQGGCTDISHSVSGGGARTSASIGDIRAQILPHAHNADSPCGFIDLDAYPSLTPEMRAANANLPQMSENSVLSGEPTDSPFDALPVPLFEGETTRFTIDLGRPLKAGERVDLALQLSGATPGEDYTLALPADGNQGVTVLPDSPLTEASPVLVFSEGAQTAELTLAALDDAEFEMEVLTVSFGELRQSVQGATEEEVSNPQGSLVFALIDSTGPPLAIMGLEDASIEENTPWSAAPRLEGMIGARAVWSLSGPDAAAFVLDAETGVLTLPGQDYEVPADADGNNVYEAVLAATDSGGTSAVPFKVAVVDADGELTVVLAAEKRQVPEDNGRVKFTITLSRPLAAGETAVVPFTVKGGGKENRDWNLRFRAKDNGPEVERTATGRNSAVTFTEGGQAATLMLIARPNHDVEKRVIAIAFGTGDRAPHTTGVAGGIAPAGDALLLTVVDDDAAAGPAFVVQDARTRESTGAMRFAVLLNMPSTETAKVRVRTRNTRPASARAGKDYVPLRSELHFRPGETKKLVRVDIINDAHDEDSETFELVLSNAEGAIIADRVATGTIVNDDPLPAAYLARFGRTVAEQVLEGIAGRLSALRTPDIRATIAGHALDFDRAASDQESAIASALSGHDNAFGDPYGFGMSPWQSSSMELHSLSMQEALTGSSFSLTGQADPSGGSFAFWGMASEKRFEGAERGGGTDTALDGTAVTGMLGTDYAKDKWLLGAMLAQSSSEGKYSAIGEDACPDTDAELCRGTVQAGGDVEASLTAAIPYAAVQASERFKVWGAAGVGNGKVTLDTATGGLYRADAKWSMAATGLRGEILRPPGQDPGLGLALISDAMWTRTSSDRTGELAASDSETTRFRLGLEGSYRLEMDGNRHLTPRLEFGVRSDSGDAENGFGVELGSGFKWNDPSGLSLDISARTLISHENDDIKDQGFSGTMSLDPDPAGLRGLSLQLKMGRGGSANGGLDMLFAPTFLEQHVHDNDTGSRWNLEMAYGIPAFGGRYTGSPHFGLGLAASVEDYMLGWRLTKESTDAVDVHSDIKAMRRESETAEPEHIVGFEIEVRW